MHLYPLTPVHNLLDADKPLRFLSVDSSYFWRRIKQNIVDRGQVYPIQIFIIESFVGHGNKKVNPRPHKIKEETLPDKKKTTDLTR